MTQFPTKTINMHGEAFVVALTNAWDTKFWSDFDGSWEPESFAFVRQSVTPGCVYVDIGAWIGPLALYAARLGASVVALEPDPLARTALTENFELNALHADICAAGFGSKSEQLRLRPAKAGLGSSMTSSLDLGSQEQFTVDTLDADDVLEKIQAQTAVLKVDIEGHEFSAGHEIEKLWRQSNAPMNLALHPRMLYRSMKLASTSALATFGNRKQVFNATNALLEKFDHKGSLPGNGKVLTAGALRRQFGPLLGRNRNFEIQLPAAGT